METIDDIVREMRVMANVSENGYCIQFCDEFADRIEAAANAEREVHRGWCDRCEAGEVKSENARLCAALKAEEDAHEVTHAHLVSLRKEFDRSGELLEQAEADRDRLRAALKPVLECDLNSPNIMKSWGAVRDAQRIYNEKSEVKHEAH